MLDKKTLCPFLYQFQPSLEGGNVEKFYIRDKNANAGNLHKNRELTTTATTINCVSSSAPAVPEKSENAQRDADVTQSESDGPHEQDEVKLDKEGNYNSYTCMPTLTPVIPAGEINFSNPSSILSSQPRNANIYNRNPSGRISLLIEPRPLIVQSQQRQQPSISKSKKPKLSPQQPQLSGPRPSQSQEAQLPPVLIRAKKVRPKLTPSASTPTPALTTNNNNSNSRERPSESPRPPQLSPVKPLPLQGQSNGPHRQKMVTCLQKRGSEWIITKKEGKPKRPSTESPPTLTRFDSSTSSNVLGAACVRNVSRNASSRYSLRSAEELQKAKDLARLVYVIPHKPPQKESRKKKSNIFDRPFSPEVKLKSETKEEFLNNLNLIPVVREAVIDNGPSLTSLERHVSSSHKLIENENHESLSSSRAPKLPKNPINDKLGKGKSSDSSISRVGHNKVTSIRHLTNYVDVGSKISETKSKKKSFKFDENAQTTSLDLQKSTSFEENHIIDMDIDLDILDLFVSVDDRNFFTSRGLTP